MATTLEAEVELARRIIEAFSTIKAFIYQRGVDDTNLVLKVLRESGVAPLVEVRTISPRHGLYVVLVNEAICKADCTYNVCRGREDNECLAKCISECRNRVINSIIERLEKYVDRANRKLRRTNKVNHSVVNSD